MKLALYLRLACDGVRKNRRMFVPYLLMAMLMISICYILFFLGHADFISTLPGGDDLRWIMNLGAAVILIFSAIFLFYTNSFLIRRRKKEFGLYNVLGMSKRNLARIIAWETLFCAALSLAGGLAGGIVLSKLAELGLTNLMGGEPTFRFTILPRVAGGVAAAYGALFALLGLISVLRVGQSSAVTLMKSEAAGEKPPCANWVLGAAGVVMLGAAYWLAVSIENPLDAMIWFFAAVVLVILATYLLMVCTSVVFCRLLQRNKRYYYRPNHFVSVSSMVYRMKRNGAGLASICILATMVLVMISSTASLYFGAEDSLRSRFPRELNLQFRLADAAQMDDSNLDLFRAAAQEAAADCGGKMQNVMDYCYVNATGIPTADGVELDWREYEKRAISYGAVRDYYFVPQADYEAQSGETLDIPDGAVALRTYRCDDAPLELRLRRGGTLRVSESRKGSMNLSYAQNSTIATIVVVVPDMRTVLAALPTFQDGMGSSTFRWGYGFDTGLDADGQRAVGEALRERVQALSFSEEQGYEMFSLSLREDNRDDFYGNYGGLLFLGLLLSLVFILAAVLILYYKQISEGYEDQARFAIMQNVGMQKREIRASINSQLLTVFFLPLGFAGVHMVFAFPMIRRILTLFALYNVRLFALVTLASFGAFALLYTAVYRMTAAAYYRIVSGGQNE